MMLVGWLVGWPFRRSIDLFDVRYHRPGERLDVCPVDLHTPSRAPPGWMRWWLSVGALGV